jgi:DNA-binding response OmpR family regulator
MSEALRGRPGVLVVEDDPCLRTALAEVLAQDGFDVSSASNGFTGLRLAAIHHPRVMLLDLVLPELSGLDVLRELRSQPATRDIRVIVVTGQTSASAAACAAGADLFFEKPFDINELLSAVHRTVHRTTAVAPAVETAASVSPAGLPAHGARLYPRHRTSARRVRRRHS